MKNEWTRDDLPHQHEVWDNFVAGKHSDVFHAVGADDLGEVLDEIVDHLNAHHPKSQQYDCGETIDALNRNRDALIENRDKSISSLQRLLANTECHEDRWRRAHEIVERERDTARDQWKKWEHKANEAEREVSTWRTSTESAHSDFLQAAHDRDKWRARAEAAEARTAPAVSRADVAETLSRCLNPEMWNVTFPSVVSEVCDLFGVETEQAADPVEVKAQELCREAFPDHGWGNAPWDTEDYWLPIENGFRRLAAHVLRQEADHA